MNAEVYDHFVHMTPEILAAAEQLERVVSPGVFNQIVRLAVLVDDHSGSRMQRTLDEERNRVLAHFGADWARLYAIVQHHIQQDAYASCTVVRNLEAICTLPPVDPWARTEVTPMTPEPFDPATEALIAAHLADPALVRDIVAGHVIGYGLHCHGLAADGRCHCADATQAVEE